MPGVDDIFVQRTVEFATGRYIGSVYVEPQTQPPTPGRERCDDTVSLGLGEPDRTEESPS